MENLKCQRGDRIQRDTQYAGASRISRRRSLTWIYLAREPLDAVSPCDSTLFSRSRLSEFQMLRTQGEENWEKKRQDYGAGMGRGGGD